MGRVASFLEFVEPGRLGRTPPRDPLLLQAMPRVDEPSQSAEAYENRPSVLQRRCSNQEQDDCENQQCEEPDRFADSHRSPRIPPIIDHGRMSRGTAPVLRGSSVGDRSPQAPATQ